MYAPSFDTPKDSERRAPEAAHPSYEVISRDLEAVRRIQADIRASIDRCEALPRITSQRLLNLPTMVGRVVE